MPLHVTITPEQVDGACMYCGWSTKVHRVFIEAGEHSGTSPELCNVCLNQHMGIIHAILEAPEKPSGAHPPTKAVRRAVLKQAKDMVALAGGQIQKASGAMVGAKGDHRVPGVIRGEQKLTTKRSRVIKREELDKIRGECLNGEKPYFHLRFVHPVTLAAEDDWVLIPLEDWEHAKHAAD